MHELQGLWAPWGLTRFSTDGWGADERDSTPEQHVIGKQCTQNIESQHSKLRTRIKRLGGRTLCFSTTPTLPDLVVGLCITRYEFG